MKRKKILPLSVTDKRGNNNKINKDTNQHNLKKLL